MSHILEKCSDYEELIRSYHQEIDLKADISEISAENNVKINQDTNNTKLLKIFFDYISSIPDHILIDTNFLCIPLIKGVDQAVTFTKTLPFVNQALLSRLIAFIILLYNKITDKNLRNELLKIVCSVLIKEPKTNSELMTPQILQIFIDDYFTIFSEIPSLTEDVNWISQSEFKNNSQEKLNRFLSQQSIHSMTMSRSTSDGKLNNKKSKSLHNLKAVDQDAFVANEEEDDEPDHFYAPTTGDDIQITARQRDYSINYLESDASEEEAVDEEGFEDGEQENGQGFEEEDVEEEADETIFDDVDGGNGKIDRIILSREVNKSMEYLVTMQGSPYPIAQWIPLTILMEIPNYKTALTRFTETESKFSFYVAETYTFSTKWDSPVHVVGHREMDNGQNMFLLQYTVSHGTAYYWEVKNSTSPNNVIDHYMDTLVHVEKTIPTRPTLIPEIELSEAETFKSHSGFLPKEYQITGVNWLLQCFCDQHGSLLADEMGLGKTIQAIIFLRKLRDIGWEGPHIIAVRNNTYNQWCKELEEWSDFNYVMYKGDPNDRLILRTFRISPDKKDHKYRFNVLLVAYDILIKDYEYFRNINFEVMIIDEGHRIKQRYGQTHLAFDTLKAQHRIIMTGTPIQNTLQELWSLLNFVSPDYFDNPDLFPDEEVDSMEPAKMLELRRMITPHLMRRSLDEVEKSLVPKDERFVFLHLTPAQKDLTRLVKMHELWRIQGQERDNYQESQMLHRICNHPFMVEGSEEYYTAILGMERSKALVETCCKFQFLDLILPIFKKQNRSVLIFSQRIKVLQLLAEYCQLRKYTYVMLDGQLSADDKKTAIDSFVSDNSDVFIFLISTKSGAEGLNLTKASVTIIFDPDWNPNNDLQALGRCHRIGQTKRVLVLRLITFGTYEHTMYTRAQKKLKLWDAVLGDTDLHFRIKLKPKRNTSMLFKPYTPIHFSYTEKQAELEEPKEEIVQPPELNGLHFNSKDSFEDVLAKSSTVVTDLLKYKDQKEIEWDLDESVDDFLKRFTIEDVSLNTRKKKKSTPTYQIDLIYARRILSALEKYGYSKKSFERIQKEIVPDCPIETVKKFCTDSIVLFFRSLEPTGFLHFPILSQVILTEKNANLPLLMSPDREDWLSVPFTRRGSVVVSVKQLFSSIHRTAPYFLFSLEAKLIVEKFTELNFQFNFDDLTPPAHNQQITDEQILQELLTNSPTLTDENRSHFIVHQMKKQIIESEKHVQAVLTPYWGRTEVFDVLGLLKNFGGRILKMTPKEIQWRTGVISKPDHSVKLLATRIMNSFKVSLDLVLPLKIPSGATGVPSEPNPPPFPENYVIDQREMLSVTRRSGIMTSIDLALEKVTDDSILFEGDNKGWFTNHHFVTLLSHMKEYGFDSVSNLLLSNREFTEHLSEADITAISTGNDISENSILPLFITDEVAFFDTIKSIIGKNPLEVAKELITEYRQEQDLASRSRPLNPEERHSISKEKSQKSKVSSHLKIVMPRISSLTFHDGRGKDMEREVDKAEARYRRNIPMDERRAIFAALQGKLGA
ncbi:SNF2 family N-terminal domain containing protein [Trichomonas vaginalis G3]|uniref:SNF2 family N-terminal domain containing protein n=1 Tax=Trichomonas vaginalis (strain ATCC PRA-98 / G3) TaxID=412133 RepID=A2FLI2_TRIV3|nr:chromodomain-helicase-DNA-binding protein 3-related-related family [Trichomonas vaginalis G3]EAX94232.1 SNF2 family N-terminal domain containing protein [Trichomonas vaginalis G3]KAI5503591.1 chromodomain-helicase-DNA-binding protein 3-related-related family [Trichomonas vaginalis G3]|eukprot:XP_001307162.1 SNF2 family N-terminal domain containing protein [Trichomonas vaginalis G3]